MLTVHMKMNSLLTILIILKFIEISGLSYCENFMTCSECIRSTRENCVWCFAIISSYIRDWTGIAGAAELFRRPKNKEDYNKPIDNLHYTKRHLKKKKILKPFFKVGQKWQLQNEHDGNRCYSKDLMTDDWCTNLYDPPVKNNVVNNSEWNAGEDGARIVQFKPQFVQIKARPGVAVNVKMSYKPAKNSALDVYYLIDDSHTMNTYKEHIKEQLVNIYKELSRITDEVKLGIGSVSEKLVLPYMKSNLQYSSFKNHESLTKNTTKVQLVLEKKTEGNNYGDRRAVLDGVMQTMVCGDQIGWREGSRHVIIVFTDALYHSAGDGKVVGALQKHDMKCHIDGTTDTTLDYPSISQINKVAKENGYTVIIVAPEAVKMDYETLTQNIIGAKYFSLDGEVDIGKLVADNYQDIIENVEITQDSSPYVEITTKVLCPDCKATNTQQVDIVATLKVTSCPPLPRRKEYIRIGPKSLNETLTVEIEFDCECDCEKDVNPELDVAKCNGAGTYQCGICLCNPNRYGYDCKCEGDSSNTNDLEKCKENTNQTLYCSGHGVCRCGKCEECNDSFSGQFCEISNKACKRLGGVPCSGNGECRMDVCVCKPNWTGDDCRHSIDVLGCMAPHSHEVCSGNGACVKGKCVCGPKNNLDQIHFCKGQFCNDCQELTTQPCEDLQEYAYCVFLGKTSCENKYNETETRVVIVKRNEMNSPNHDWFLANSCKVRKEDDSIFVFKYHFVPDMRSNKNILELVIQNELDKLQPANIWVAVVSSLGGTLLIGILSVVLWKYLTEIYDKTMFTRYEKKARAAGYVVTANSYFDPPLINN